MYICSYISFHNLEMISVRNSGSWAKYGHKKPAVRREKLTPDQLIFKGTEKQRSLPCFKFSCGNCFYFTAEIPK